MNLKKTTLFTKFRLSVDSYLGESLSDNAFGVLAALGQKLQLHLGQVGHRWGWRVDLHLFGGAGSEFQIL